MTAISRLGLSGFSRPAIAAAQADLTIIVSDSVALFEAVVVEISDLGVLEVSTNDQVTVSEASATQVPLSFSVSDAIAITDAPSIIAVLLLFVAETVTLSEVVTFDPLLIDLSVSDAVTLAESIGFNDLTGAVIYLDVAISDEGGFGGVLNSSVCE